MDIGIPLSQLASQSPISTACESLDSLLEGGFKPGCMYEIYGPPGSYKETLLKNVLNASSRHGFKNLVIQTHKPITYSRLSNNNNNGTTYTTRITKFSQLLRFLQLRDEMQQKEQQHKKHDYTVLVIDGFAQLLVDHTNFFRRTTSATTATATTPNANSDYTTKRLNLLLSVLTKYATNHHAIVLLVNHSMVVQREHNSNPGNANHFLVANPLKKAVLTSALEWGNALSGKDAIGSRLLRYRLGLFWNWDQDPKHNCSASNNTITTSKHVPNPTPHRRPTVTVLQGGAALRTASEQTATAFTTTIPFHANNSHYGYDTDDDNDVFTIGSNTIRQLRESELEHTTVEESQ